MALQSRSPQQPDDVVVEVAEALGAADAVMLDGGGSSTMAVRTGRGVLRVDAPAGAPQRPVPNAVVLVRR